MKYLFEKVIGQKNTPIFFRGILESKSDFGFNQYLEQLKQLWIYTTHLPLVLTQKHQELKRELEKINNDVKHKFANQDNFKKKIDELNQETETLVYEIEKWQM